jgi:hypothetical protein
MTEHKTFIRKIKQGEKIRYAEVWNERQGNKIIQHHVRYLGSDPENLPETSSFAIENLQFGYLAQLILRDSLSANDIYTMLDGMGKSIERKEIKQIVFRYKLDEKKTHLQIIFLKKRKMKMPIEDSLSNTHTSEK